jgi:hypothetical protein
VKKTLKMDLVIPIDDIDTPKTEEKNNALLAHD